MSQHLKSAGDSLSLPETGLRISRAGQFGVILQSRDKVGRRFPLLLLCARDGATISPQKADFWIEQLLRLALDAVMGELSADQFEIALSKMDAVEWDQAGSEQLMMWSKFKRPAPVSINCPADALQQICA